MKTSLILFITLLVSGYYNLKHFKSSIENEALRERLSFQSKMLDTRFAFIKELNEKYKYELKRAKYYKGLMRRFSKYSTPTYRSKIVKLNRARFERFPKNNVVVVESIYDFGLQEVGRKLRKDVSPPYRH